MPLPYCLEVITDLSEYELSEDLAGAVNDMSLALCHLAIVLCFSAQ